MTLSLQELLVLERNPIIPDKELPSDSSRVRRMILRHQGPFTVGSISEGLGTEPDKAFALAGQVLLKMRAAGWQFDKATIPGVNKLGHSVQVPTYRLLNPEHTPTDADLAATRQKRHKAAIAPKAKAKVKKSTEAVHVPAEPPINMIQPLNLNGHSPELISALPRLTEAVFVVGQIIDGDGGISMMLRDGNGITWAVDVHGASGPAGHGRGSPR